MGIYLFGFSGLRVANPLPLRRVPRVLAVSGLSFCGAGTCDTPEFRGRPLGFLWDPSSLMGLRGQEVVAPDHRATSFGSWSTGSVSWDIDPSWPPLVLGFWTGLPDSTYVYQHASIHETGEAFLPTDGIPGLFGHGAHKAEAYVLRLGRPTLPRLTCRILDRSGRPSFLGGTCIVFCIRSDCLWTRGGGFWPLRND